MERVYQSSWRPLRGPHIIYLTISSKFSSKRSWGMRKLRYEQKTPWTLPWLWTGSRDVRKLGKCKNKKNCECQSTVSADKEVNILTKFSFCFYNYELWDCGTVLKNFKYVTSVTIMLLHMTSALDIQLAQIVGLKVIYASE